MMNNIKQREKKIQEKRKQTPRKVFVKEICSRQPLVFYKNAGKISRYPETWRIGSIISQRDFQNQRDILVNDTSSLVCTDFFDSLQLLQKSCNYPNLFHDYINENSDYADIIYWTKNTYLSFSVGDTTKNILYSYTVNTNCTTVLNSCQIYTNCSSIYSSNYVTNSYEVFYSKNIHNSSHVWFSADCVGCENILFCSWLSNCSYCIRNVSYAKEEYARIKEELLQNKEKFSSYYETLPVHYDNIDAGWCEWIALKNCESIKNAKFVTNTHQGNNLLIVDGTPSSSSLYDTISVGLDCVDFYWVNCWGTHCNNIYLSTNIWSCSNIYYSDYLINCSYCLGCIWLKNKSFCILNRQFTKEERFEKIDEIFTQMERDWVLWDFLPWSMNPFYFNDTVASLIEDFSKEEVLQDWYLWRNDEIKVDIPDWAQILDGKYLNEYQWFDMSWKWTINPEILNKVIKDEKGNIYRIVSMELEFLQKYWLPLPEIHWLDRIKLWFKFK